MSTSVRFKYNFGESINFWKINDDPTLNPITIGKNDFLLGYLSHNDKGNKGGNSYVFALYDAQNYDENSSPVNVIKFSKFNDRYYPKKDEIVQSLKNRRFGNEIKALIECKTKKYQNIIDIENDLIGHCEVSPNSYYPFYVMEYADTDLKSFIKDEDLSGEEKIELCLQIAQGLKELDDLEYYHRDLKPENIFIVNGLWKIGDLGLVNSRILDAKDDSKSIIGPKGWLSPEAMNRYLTENKLGYDCNIDHQSDIFQLGKVFWYIMQGNAPIGCIKPRDYNGKNYDIYVLLRTMLNHSKKKRYKNVDEVIKILRRINKKTF